jgi:putative oxidoreductase
MVVLRAIARPMLASIFIAQGYETFRHPERVAGRAEPVVRPLAERIPAVPAKPEDAVRLNGAVQIAAGTMLALGRWPRLSSLALAATLVPTTLAGHRFWEEEDGKTRAQQRIHFLKNISMLGGLLIAAGDTAGQPSIAWRTRHAAEAAKKETSRTARTAQRQATRTVQSAQKEAARTVHSAQREAVRTVQTAQREVSQTARRAKKEAVRTARTARVSAKAGKAVGAAPRKAAQLARTR